jgi:ABC-type transport system substrate-binding protein
LANLAAGGALSLAGCGGDTDEGQDGPEYVFLAAISPTDVNWALPPPPLPQLLYPPGQTMRPDGEVIPQIVESMEITTDRVILRLQEDITWSNGEAVLAKDLGQWLQMYRALGPEPAEVESGVVVPDDWRFAFTSFQWDDRELVATSPDGLLGQLTSRFDVWSFFNEKVGSTPRAYFEEVWSTYNETYADPWQSEEHHKNATSFLEVALYNPTIEKPALRDPDNVVSCGPWMIDAVRPNEIRMRPHDGHPIMPAGANWPRLVIRPVNNINKAAAALKADAGDAFQPKTGGSGRFFSPNTSATFPDTIRQWDGKSRSGQGIILNHSHESLANRQVRAAVMHIADRSKLAENAHSVGEKPVDVPGLAAVDASWLPNEFASKLNRYEPDAETAARLLRQAGFSQSNGTWYEPDGSPFELPILTRIPARLDRPAPLLGQTFAGQLTDFGIQAQLLPLEQTTAQQRFKAGDFMAALDTWPVLLQTGHPYHRAAWWYANAVGYRVNRRPQMRLFEDNLLELVEQHDSITWKRPAAPAKSGISVTDTEPLKQLTRTSPPVGEPDGSLQEYPVVYLAVKALTEWSWDERQRREALETLMWVYNYDLPYLEITRTVPQLYHETADWKIPSAEDPIWRLNGPSGYPSGIGAALQYGKIKAKPSDSS